LEKIKSKQERLDFIRESAKKEKKAEKEIDEEQISEEVLKEYFLPVVQSVRSIFKYKNLISENQSTELEGKNRIGLVSFLAELEEDKQQQPFEIITNPNTFIFLCELLNAIYVNLLSHEVSKESQLLKLSIKELIQLEKHKMSFEIAIDTQKTLSRFESHEIVQYLNQLKFEVKEREKISEIWAEMADLNLSETGKEEEFSMSKAKEILKRAMEEKMDEQEEEKAKKEDSDSNNYDILDEFKRIYEELKEERKQKSKNSK
jgi:hypothetical protein